MFVDYATAGRAFLASLASASAFDSALPFMKNVPLASRVVATTAAVTGATPSELSVKAVSQITVGVDDIRPRKAAAIVIVSKELLRFSGPGAALFQQELRNGVVAATDAAFLAELYASVTPTASAGSTTANTLTDLDVLLSALDAWGRFSRLCGHVSLKRRRVDDESFQRQRDGLPNVELAGRRVAERHPGYPDDFPCRPERSSLLTPRASPA